MKKIIFLLAIICSSTLFAQIPNLKKMKIIRANSDTVDIRNGNVIDRNRWTIAPSLRLLTFRTVSAISSRNHSGERTSISSPCDKEKNKKKRQPITSGFTQAGVQSRLTQSR